MILPTLPSSLLYGGDYNPEQWPEAVWLDDARLMQEAGVNLVCVGIFSWAKLQSSEKAFHFGWLDRVMDLLAEHGVYVCLATATASPPPWVSKKYRDVLPVDANGATLYPGSRQHYSPCSPSYRRLAAALTRKIALRYRGHPALAAWHINNEYACHLPECHGEATTKAFRVWLRKRYGTLDKLNHAWGTAFWSQVYYAWGEIFTPRRAPYHCNPTQQLDYRRFLSDAFLELYRREKDIVNAITPGVPVTTNLMGFFKTLDYRRWAEEMDFVAWDSYPEPLSGKEPERMGRGMGAVWGGSDQLRSLLRYARAGGGSLALVRRDPPGRRESSRDLHNRFFRRSGGGDGPRLRSRKGVLSGDEARERRIERGFGQCLQSGRSAAGARGARRRGSDVARARVRAISLCAQSSRRIGQGKTRSAARCGSAHRAERRACARVASARRCRRGVGRG